MALPNAISLSMLAGTPATLTSFEKVGPGKYTDLSASREYINPQHIVVSGTDASKPSADISMLFRINDTQKISFTSSGGGVQDALLKCEAYTVYRIQRPKIGVGLFQASNPFNLAYLLDRSYALDQLVRANAAGMLARALRGET